MEGKAELLSDSVESGMEPGNAGEDRFVAFIITGTGGLVKWWGKIDGGLTGETGPRWPDGDGVGGIAAAAAVLFCVLKKFF